VANGIGIRKYKTLREEGKPPANDWREDKNQMAWTPRGRALNEMRILLKIAAITKQ